jgi:hypothetical protein
MIAYIDANKDRFGVEPICQLLPIAPSTYYAAKRRLPSARALRDEKLKGRHPPGPQGELRRLWRPQGVAAAAPRGDLGGPLYRRAADG